MTLPKKEILKKCKYEKDIELILDQAEIVIKTWQPFWSHFLSAPIREEAMKILPLLNELKWISDGGYPSAERQRIKCMRANDFGRLLDDSIPLSGLRIEGNFLFDNSSCDDFRNSLIEMGIKNEDIGDIFIFQDRGAEVICTPKTSAFLNGKTGQIRSVTIKYQAIDIKELRLPHQRIPKTFISVEASTRIDAIASAGFGLSRSKIIKEIRAGRLRLNWLKTTQASQELNSGDQIQLENKGTLEVLSLVLTKKQRWRVELLRK